MTELKRDEMIIVTKSQGGKADSSAVVHGALWSGTTTTVRGDLTPWREINTAY